MHSVPAAPRVPDDWNDCERAALGVADDVASQLAHDRRHLLDGVAARADFFTNSSRLVAHDADVVLRIDPDLTRLGTGLSPLAERSELALRTVTIVLRHKQTHCALQQRADLVSVPVLESLRRQVPLAERLLQHRP